MDTEIEIKDNLKGRDMIKSASPRMREVFKMMCRMIVKASKPPINYSTLLDKPLGEFSAIINKFGEKYEISEDFF